MSIWLQIPTIFSFFLSQECFLYDFLVEIWVWNFTFILFMHFFFFFWQEIRYMTILSRGFVSQAKITDRLCLLCQCPQLHVILFYFLLPATYRRTIEIGMIVNCLFIVFFCYFFFSIPLFWKLSRRYGLRLSVGIFICLTRLWMTNCLFFGRN